MCTQFGVDSSSRFCFRVQTNRQTDEQIDATQCYTHTSGYTAGVGKKIKIHKYVSIYNMCMCMQSRICMKCKI